MTVSLLCVGGPMHGKMVALEHAKHDFAVLVMPNNTAPFQISTEGPEDIDVVRYIYKNERLAMPFDGHSMVLVCREVVIENEQEAT